MRKKMMNEIRNFRDQYNRRCGQKQSCEDRLKRLQDEAQSLEQHRQDLQDAQTTVQEVARQTQSELEYRISSLVTNAMQSVFDEEIEMVLRFVSKRNATEAEILLKDANGNEVRPTDSDGAGLADIMAFGLRMVMYYLLKQKDAVQPVFLLDEPFKKLNDPTREMHNRTAEMVRSLADDLGVQIVIVTLLPELDQIADRVFKVEKNSEQKAVVKRMYE